MDIYNLRKRRSRTVDEYVSFTTRVSVLSYTDIKNIANAFVYALEIIHI